ncbi:MAG: RNA methyltransferase [Bacteroidales bacterium]|nr:RNA methyltransferase [Bacteroidales bacterium]
MSLSSQQIKRLQAYRQKKFRREDGVFVAETPKVIEMLLDSPLALRMLYALPAYAEAVSRRYPDCRPYLQAVTAKELERISCLTSPQQVFGIWERPHRQLNRADAFQGISLVLDGLQDPGNLGTIIRIADWFGIDRLICSEDTADAFQPKCVQASMGAVAHLPVYYADLARLAADAPHDFPFFGTFLEGENVFEHPLTDTDAWYCIGNESHGIRPATAVLINRKIHIPTFSPASAPHRPHAAESLNAAVATGILCAQIRASGR